MKATRNVIYLIYLIQLFGFRFPEPKHYYLEPTFQNEPRIQLFAANIYQEFLSTHKTLTLIETPEASVVAGISDRIINAIVSYYHIKKASNELLGFRWEVRLVAEKKIDAWCLPGGKIAVYSSLLPLTQSEASMAVFLSHVIAHTVLNHGDPRMKTYLKEFLHGKDLSQANTENSKETKDFFRRAYGNGDYTGVIRAFSPLDETEADKLGSIFSALAGYNPIEAIVFWERMDRFKETGRQPELLSSHPVDENRILKLKEIVDETIPKYYKPINKN